ncbi:DUF2663 family protein [Sporolactobacillus pectinivorans]|uniref:DUF2663 family protein n=1 Tax=Sporolactobacillus pectinivorans TaxID=1591408 RepID=UPI000C266340|nr:DUF2663 family protein [Sporolactobacillus pectinivorans]
MSLDTMKDKGMLPALTFEILQELIKRKEKETFWKKRQSIAGIFLMVSGCIFVLYFFIVRNQRLTTLHGIAQIISEPSSWLIGAAGLLLFFIYIRTYRAAEDAEDDFDELRAEVIDRGWELWPKEHEGNGRYEVMHYLLDEKDINLFYK